MAETQLTKTPDYRSIVQKTSDALLPMMTKQLESYGVKPDAYQQQCMLNAIAVMNDTAISAGITINDIERTTMLEILQQVATLRLNPFSQPRECYFQARKKKASDGTWVTTVELGIEGDGNDAILRNFGHNVEEVYPYWAVRVGDDLTFPTYHGVEVEPPSWTPNGAGKYIRVVYPVKMKTGEIRYFISERSDVLVNLKAHISNNMMNETFGIAENRYKATVEQKRQIDEKKESLKRLMDDKDIEVILNTVELQPYISPAWREGSSERMILRKMRNNAIKPIPKDFSNGLALSMYNNSMSDIVETPEERNVQTVDIPETEYREITDPAPLPAGKSTRNPDKQPTPAAPDKAQNPPADVPF